MIAFSVSMQKEGLETYSHFAWSYGTQLLDEACIKHVTIAYITPTKQLGAGYMLCWLRGNGYSSHV